jgi:hypothetical protein
MRGQRVLMNRGPQAPLDRLIERCGAHRGYSYFRAPGNSLLSEGLIHPAGDWYAGGFVGYASVLAGAEETIGLCLH